jgi:hypothetical protein
MGACGSAEAGKAPANDGAHRGDGDEDNAGEEEVSRTSHWEAKHTFVVVVGCAPRAHSLITSFASHAFQGMHSDLKLLAVVDEFYVDRARNRANTPTHVHWDAVTKFMAEHSASLLGGRNHPAWHAHSSELNLPTEASEASVDTNPNHCQVIVVLTAPSYIERARRCLDKGRPLLTFGHEKDEAATNYDVMREFTELLTKGVRHFYVEPGAATVVQLREMKRRAVAHGEAKASRNRKLGIVRPVRPARATGIDCICGSLTGNLLGRGADHICGSLTGNLLGRGAARRAGGAGGQVPRVRFTMGHTKHVAQYVSYGHKVCPGAWAASF